MSENWLSPTLCSFGEKVRVERGPQVVELECNDRNLSDEVTHPQYRVGARDAMGRLIMPEEAGDKAVKQARIDKERGVTALNRGDKMACVDWRAKKTPWLWKVYQATEFEQLNQNTGEYETVTKFIKVDEIEGKDAALARGAELYKGMK